MFILGISAFYHDSAAAILYDAEIIAAAQEERFTRIKHDQNFPINAIKYCLNEAGITIQQIDYIAFYDKPFIKFERILETYLTFAPHGIKSFMKAIPLWIKKKIWMKELIKKELNYSGEILFPEHHESHAASAFYPSPFERAAYLTLDGVGEWATTSYGLCSENGIKILGELHFPHSLGLLYSAFTYYTGFKVNSGEYKVMGLAPYGKPKYVQKIYDHLIDLKEDGSFKMNMEYFDYCAGLTMTNDKFNNLFEGKPRVPETKLTQKEMDLARSVQEVTENIMLKMAKHVKKITNEKYLCLAGGVALNCVANGKLLREKIFDDIWIQPAAGDAGGALGAAFVTYYQHLNNKMPNKNGKDLQRGSYLGPKYSNNEIHEFLSLHSLPFKYYEDEKLLDVVSDFISAGKVIGWFQGRMEFGPRALGSRTIIGDARSPEMQKNMNLKIKFREGFRPFAPSVLAEKASDWFEIDRESPYMLLVAEVKKEKQRKMTIEEENLWGIEQLNIIRSEIPAVTHIDYSARLQTVNRQDNPRYHALINRFYEKTGCPVIVNTSFNVRGEPIVQSPKDAYTCFMRTGIDVLVLENFVLCKEEQPEFHDDLDWRQKYELD
ncbi:MAG: carbamoyltransferase [Ignavibacteriaceae bacterium]|nr:carbamoyltransferase [Ignavibacteriaceae bacterium]